MLETGFSGAILKGLCDRQILKTGRTGTTRFGREDTGEFRANLLTEEQNLALQHIRSSFAKKKLCFIKRGYFFR